MSKRLGLAGMLAGLLLALGVAAPSEAAETWFCTMNGSNEIQRFEVAGDSLLWPHDDITDVLKFYGANPSPEVFTTSFRLIRNDAELVLAVSEGSMPRFGDRASAPFIEDGTPYADLVIIDRRSGSIRQAVVARGKYPVQDSHAACRSSK